MSTGTRWLAMTFTLLLAACADSQPDSAGRAAAPAESQNRQATPAAEPASAPATPALRPRVVDATMIARGAELFASHCAGCHGARAEGHPQWRQRDERGRFRPPPLDGSGHDWHHPFAELHSIIKQGRPPAISDMPAWGGQLNDGEISAIIAWFQSLWPDEVYEQWAIIDANAAASLQKLPAE